MSREYRIQFVDLSHAAKSDISHRIAMEVLYRQKNGGMHTEDEYERCYSAVFDQLERGFDLLALTDLWEYAESEGIFTNKERE